ncbi:glycosyl transferase family 1 [Clostridium sp. CT7]|uniref:glycosyltransferase family 4 protein n=2 Tax=Clostridium TaxID=1485 RepID=UPI0008247F7F|nr:MULTISPECIES: glycosyltransferase family 4 protein [Clostridium]PJI10409.1 glycosyl transferase family 1 [Clostridium sp. CT7]
MMSKKVAFLSTYPSRKCGIATFTQDLINEIYKTKLIDEPYVIAINDDKYEYDNRVVFEINQFDRESYIQTAKKVNESDIELLVIEHEYGIFGGESGEYILDFIDNLNIPFITTLHTVLPNPSLKQKEILKKLIEKSSKIVTMAKNTVPILTKIYGALESKIEVIPHGVPKIRTKTREELKKINGLGGKTIVSTFGLISPSKGLNYGIKAIAKVAEKHDNIEYLILGATHPTVKKNYGEKYRESLMELVKKLGIEKNVQFLNKYLTKKEIITYLRMSDMYMTPYLGKDQAVSGTLAYAVGYGKVIISTPYSYAREMLKNCGGLLGEFEDENSLAKCINWVIENPEEKKKIEAKTKRLGKNMMWDNVANSYIQLFLKVIEDNCKVRKMVV